MATAHIRMGGVMGAGVPVLSAAPTATQSISTTASSQVTTITSKGEFARISAVGGMVRYAVGQSPTALAGSGDWVLDGDSVDFGPLAYNDKIAVIDGA